MTGVRDQLRLQFQVIPYDMVGAETALDLWWEKSSSVFVHHANWSWQVGLLQLWQLFSCRASWFPRILGRLLLWGELSNNILARLLLVSSWFVYANRQRKRWSWGWQQAWIASPRTKPTRPRWTASRSGNVEFTRVRGWRAKSLILGAKLSSLLNFPACKTF